MPAGATAKKKGALANGGLPRERLPAGCLPISCKHDDDDDFSRYTVDDLNPALP